jgi:hypothetical protein
MDTLRGTTNTLFSDTTGAASTAFNSVTAYNSNGFTVGTSGVVNTNTAPYASWTFREAPNFFDVVTYTGDGTDNRQISHNLGVAPGFIIVKSTSSTNGWACWHRGNGTTNYNLRLNSTGEGYTPTNIQGFPVAASSTTFTVRSGENGWGDATYSANASGQTYVAYLFAHDPSADGIIQCGSYTAGSSPVVTLGWEPQWLMIKNATVGGTYLDWYMFDNMRKLDVSNSGNAPLRANTADAEGGTYATSGYNLVQPTATGFIVDPSGAAPSGVNNGSNTYIYMAIRRGPMRTPTLGTSVFSPVLQSTQSPNTLRTVGFPADFIIGTSRGGNLNRLENTRLTGFANNSGGSINTPGMFTNATSAESNQYPLFYNVWNTTARDGDYLYFSNNINWFFRRAPGFMDVVCYKGTGATFGSVTHGLGVKPELLICKNRTTSENWYVQYQNPVSGVITQLRLNTNEGDLSGGGFNGHLFPTFFYVWNNGPVLQNNTAGSNYVSYLFASVPGVSKVGSYTGNGSSQTINCAFTTGARFVLIKRTDSTGDWYVWDSARGIVAGNDPYLALNDTQAEVTNNDSVDPDSTGFIVNQVAASNINVNGATYIFLSVS